MLFLSKDHVFFLKLYHLSHIYTLLNFLYFSPPKSRKPKSAPTPMQECHGLLFPTLELSRFQMVTTRGPIP